MKQDEALAVLKNALENGHNLYSMREALKVAIEALTPTEEKTPADIKEACSQVSGTPLDYFLAGMSYYKNGIWHGNEDLPEATGELQEIPVIFVSQFYCDEWLRKGSLINDPDSDDGWIIIDRPTGDNLQMSAVEKWCYAEDKSMIYNPKFTQKHCIDRRMKHGKCRYDEKKPTGRFCAYWKIRICEKNCDDCKKGKTLSL